MFTIYLAIVLLTTVIGLVSSNLAINLPQRQRGCGPVGINIDPILEKENQTELVSCCVKHDACYSTCGMNRSTCNDNFLSCMKNACANQNPPSSKCLGYANTLYLITKTFGIPSYKVSQLVRGCSKSSE